MSVDFSHDFFQSKIYGWLVNYTPTQLKKGSTCHIAFINLQGTFVLICVSVPFQFQLSHERNHRLSLAPYDGQPYSVRY